MKPFGLAALMLFATIAGANGQESSLPEACLAPPAGHEMEMPKESMDMAPMDEAHKDMMDGMGDMNSQMAQAMMAEDIDVAFICGMIPHHQGAIDMAKVLKSKSKDPALLKLADDIIAAREKEMAFMKEWLAKHEAAQ
jgi:uncharacterized protein (DUF305 family)